MRRLGRWLSWQRVPVSQMRIEQPRREAVGWTAFAVGFVGLAVLIVGLIFGWAWDRWRSLPHLVAVHWAIDALPSVSSFLGIEF